MLSAIARSRQQPAEIRIAAIKELNKVDGRHSMQHSAAGKLTLEMLLEESWRGGK